MAFSVRSLGGEVRHFNVAPDTPIATIRAQLKLGLHPFSTVTLCVDDKILHDSDIVKACIDPGSEVQAVTSPPLMGALDILLMGAHLSAHLSRLERTLAVAAVNFVAEFVEDLDEDQAEKIVLPPSFQLCCPEDERTSRRSWLLAAAKLEKELKRRSPRTKRRRKRRDEEEDDQEEEDEEVRSE